MALARSFTVALGLVLGAGACALAQAEAPAATEAARPPVVVTGSLEGKRSRGTVYPPQGDQPLRVTIGDLQGEARRTGKHTWRVTLLRYESVGAAGRLAGDEDKGEPTRFQALIQRKGDKVRVLIRKGRRLAGRLQGEVPRRLEDGAQPDDLKRDAWWARHGVATWGFARALWDFYKPGSRRLEELRSDITREETQELFDELQRTAAKPWRAKVIFTAARARVGSDREALQLAFALMVDHRTVPLRPFPGLENEPIHDKYEHFFASAILAHRSNARGSFGIGWMKEVMDEVSGSGYSEPDLIADALGAEFGQQLHAGQVLDP